MFFAWYNKRNTTFMSDTDDVLSQPFSNFAAPEAATSPVSGTVPPSTPPSPEQPVVPPPQAPSSPDPLGTTNELMTKMRIPLFLFCMFIAFAIAAIVFFMTQKKPAPEPSAENVVPTSQPTEATTSANPQSNSADLPPLYPGVEWEATKSGEIPFRDKSNNLLKLVGSSTEGKIRVDTSKAFVEYYNSWFGSKQWKQLEYAGEPPTEIYEYGNSSDKYFRFGIQQKDGGTYKAFVEYN